MILVTMCLTKRKAVNKSVVVALNGGLGNQLWGWAAGFALAQNLGLGLVLDASGLHQRRYQLSEVRTEANTRGKAGFNYLPGGHTLNRFLDRWLPSRPSEEFQERSFSFDVRFKEITGATLLRGFFQSPRYFEGHEAEIRSRVLSASNLPTRANIVHGLALPEEFIAVHIRLGDYLLARDVFPALDSHYYRAGISKAREVFPVAKVVVFTDSLDLSRKILPVADVFVGPETLSDPLDNLLAMSTACALVGSNSSFSWWAGYLMSHQNCVRVFPERWFRDSTVSSHELILPGWFAL